MCIRYLVVCIWYVGVYDFKSPFTSREEGLRRGFAALDKEQTGKIPMDKFKRRLREVTNVIIDVNINNNIHKCAKVNFVNKVCTNTWWTCVRISLKFTLQSVRLTEAEAQQVVRFLRATHMIIGRERF